MLLAVHKIFVGKSWYQSFVWQDLDPDAIWKGLSGYIIPPYPSNRRDFSYE
jgi:hypothetical protein